MSKTPVTILTGYLGSGKTTLLNRILTYNHGMKLAVIVNEIGTIGIDHQLVVQSEDDVIEMTNGCICCTFREDLIQTLQKLQSLKKEGSFSFEGVLLETTGVANPGPIISSFFLDAEVNMHYSINGIVTVVDAFHIEKHLKKGEEAANQLAYGDVILLNKCDLLSVNQIEALKTKLQTYNASATVIPTIESEVNVQDILRLSTFHTKDKIYPPSTETYVHREGIVSFTLETEEFLDFQALNEWMSAIVHELSENLYRYKGILSIYECSNRLVFQGVHAMFAAKFDRPWNEGEQRKSQLVFIGKNLNKEWFEQSFQQLIVKE